MIDIASDVKNYINAQINNLFASMTYDEFASTAEALMIRRDPSTAVEKPFIDGSFSGQQQLAFYARSKTPATARNTLQQILDLFNEPSISLTDAICMSAKQVSTISFVGKLTTGESIYTCTIIINYDCDNPIE